MTINFREPSTRRGVVWLIGGGYILYKAFSGEAVDVDHVINRVDFWLGVVMAIAGGLGLLPDASPPRVDSLRNDSFNDLRRHNAPPKDQIDARSRSPGEGPAAAHPCAPGSPAGGMRNLPPRDRPLPPQPRNADPPTNPVGFGDRDSV